MNKISEVLEETKNMASTNIGKRITFEGKRKKKKNYFL